VVAIKLREAMEAYRRRTGERMTYKLLAERTGIAHGTLQIMGSQPGYNATIATLEKICRALGVDFGNLLELIDDPPKPKAKAKRTTKK
jgi:DNA-binding Xre family transcriptional regulator